MNSPLTLCFSRCLAATLLLLGIAATAQQSYRSYQKLSGQILKRNDSRQVKPPTSDEHPMPFRGWKHSKKFGSTYQRHFSRQRAQVARAKRLLDMAKAADRTNTSLPPSLSAPLPGIFLRTSLPAGFIPDATATGDFNGDGKVDFAVANGGDNNLWFYFSKGDGTFNLPTILPVTLGASPVWMVSADLRGTGKSNSVAG